jgi:hypothetical protein
MHSVHHVPDPAQPWVCAESAKPQLAQTRKNGKPSKDSSRSADAREARSHRALACDALDHADALPPRRCAASTGREQLRFASLRRSV